MFTLNHLGHILSLQEGFSKLCGKCLSSDKLLNSGESVNSDKTAWALLDADIEVLPKASIESNWTSLMSFTEDFPSHSFFPFPGDLPAVFQKRNTLSSNIVLFSPQ